MQCVAPTKTVTETTPVPLQTIPYGQDTVRAQIYRHPLLPNFADSTDSFSAKGVAVNKNIHGTYSMVQIVGKFPQKKETK